jgi:hypothetical protein
MYKKTKTKMKQQGMKDIILKERRTLGEIQQETVWKDRDIWKIWSSDDSPTEEMSDVELEEEEVVVVVVEEKSITCTQMITT